MLQYLIFFFVSKTSHIHVYISFMKTFLLKFLYIFKKSEQYFFFLFVLLWFKWQRYFQRYFNYIAKYLPGA